MSISDRPSSVRLSVNFSTFIFFPKTNGPISIKIDTKHTKRRRFKLGQTKAHAIFHLEIMTKYITKTHRRNFSRIAAPISTKLGISILSWVKRIQDVAIISPLKRAWPFIQINLNPLHPKAWMKLVMWIWRRRCKRETYTGKWAGDRKNSLQLSTKVSYHNSNSVFLGFIVYLGWKLMWAFLIACRQSPVRLSVSLSVCKLHIFNFFSRITRPLQPNLAQSILGWRGFKFVQMNGQFLSKGRQLGKSKNKLTTFKNLLLQNQWANFNQTWHKTS